MFHTKAVVILEVMWGETKAEAPGFFRINPYNFTGSRLYYFLGHEHFLVTNACREMVATAKGRGTPDPERLAKNLQRLTYDLLLVCGLVARKTFNKCGHIPDCKVVYIKHPAARDWTTEQLEQTRSKLHKLGAKHVKPKPATL